MSCRILTSVVLCVLCRVLTSVVSVLPVEKAATSIMNALGATWKLVAAYISMVLTRCYGAIRLYTGP
eukprot:2506581-Rhodomonas_salina.3